MIPTLTTARLTLRPQTMADFPAFAAFMASPRAQFMGGLPDGSQAWDWFASDQAQWSLMGWGALSVTESASGRLVGKVSVIQPPHFPETELGWIAYAEGRGFLTEAATALIPLVRRGMAPAGELSSAEIARDRLSALLASPSPAEARITRTIERVGEAVRVAVT